MNAIQLGAAAGLGVAMLALAGCQGGGTGAKVETAQAAESPAHPMPKLDPAMDRFARLAGRWEQDLDKDGKAEMTVEYKVTSGGSAVVETLFPGTAEEMTTMYHMDGDKIVMTHYCLIGNQPRMEASPSAGDTLEFTLRDITNGTREGTYMGGMKMTFVDAGHIRQQWQHFSNGAKGGEAVFEFRRVR